MKGASNDLFESRKSSMSKGSSKIAANQESDHQERSTVLTFPTITTRQPNVTDKQLTPLQSVANELVKEVPIDMEDTPLKKRKLKEDNHATAKNTDNLRPSHKIKKPLPEILRRPGFDDSELKVQNSRE